MLETPCYGALPEIATPSSPSCITQIPSHQKLTPGIPESKILFLNLICAPEGIAAFKEEFPELRIVTAFVDEGLDERKSVALVFVFCFVWGGIVCV